MGHYYENTAAGVEPRHFVPMTSRPGEFRPTRLNDAKKSGWYPSVTTIQNLLDKPALTNWKIDEHLKQAWELFETPQMGNRPQTQDEYIDYIKRCTQAELDKAPKDGTDIHDSLEKWSRAEIQDLSAKDREICGAAFEAVKQATGISTDMWACELSFVHPMGYAGKVDLHRAKGTSWVLDWKSKNTADKWKPGKMHYPEMAMQLAAYRVGLGLDNARCANVFICLEDGAVEFHEWDNAELDKQFANFADLLRIWLRNAGYIPGSPALSQ